MPFAQFQRRLKETGVLPDKDISVVETLLFLGALERETANLEPYQAHIMRLHEALEAELTRHPHSGEPVLDYRLSRLKAVIAGQFGYTGDADADDYDDPDKINFLTFIDRRSGIPVAVGALYFELARRRGWHVEGLNFPGHFLLRMEDGASRCIIDPFHDGNCLNASGLRQLLKSIAGPDAELQHNYYDAVTTRDIILRFCNNRKTRLITQGDYAQALKTVEHELWVAPDEPRLYFDAGILRAKLGHLKEAISDLSRFAALSDDVKTVAQAHAMIAFLRGKLH